MLKSAWLAMFAALCLMPPARAADPLNCGTVVIPTGLGTSPSADLTSFNPLLVNSIYNQEAAWLLYPSLVWVNRFQAIDWSRSLASAITTPDGGQTYHITLRPWHWSDGVPVTSADVAYSLTLIRQLGDTWPGEGTGGMPGIIQSLTVNDATHFTLVLTHRVNPTWFIYNGLTDMPPLPQHDWGRYTLDQIWQLQSSPAFFNVVDGPLKVTKLDIGQDAIFVPNPAYDGPKLHFNRLVFRFLDGDGAAMQAVEAGDMDMANLPAELWNAAQHLPGVHNEVLAPQSSWNYIQINFRNPAAGFFNDVRVRQAMADAIDQQRISALVYHGQGIDIYGPVPPDPPDFLSPAMKAGHYPVGYNPAAARALLLQAGYRPGPDGIMQKDGKPLSFVFLMLSGDAAIEQTTDLMEGEFRAVGIGMQVREVEFNQMLALLDGPPERWQAAFLSMNLSGYPSGEGLFQTGAFENSGAYSDKTMDALIKDSVTEPGLQGLYAYEDYASAQQPVIFAGGQKVTVLVRNRIHGLSQFIDPLGQFAPDKLSCTAATR
jgi:peptide/nickel transport system substrate-binding protein